MRNYQIHFIRHGFTKENEQSVIIAKNSNPSLSKKSITEILENKNKFEYPKVDKVYTSPLKRCTETVDLLYPDNYIQIVEKLTDIDLGEFDGQTLENLSMNSDYLNWVKDSTKFTPPKGESVQAFSLRCKEAFKEIVATMIKEKTYSIAIMTHASVLMHILSEFGLPKKSAFEWIIGYGKGVSSLLNLQIWSNNKLIELAGILPHGETKLQ